MAELGKPHVMDLKLLESKLGGKKFHEFALECEAAFKERVEEILQAALNVKNLRAVLLSGPTSSGKTTFATLFAKGLSDRGLQGKRISLDDYYLEQPVGYDEQGRPDYESANCLELTLLSDHLERLSKGERVVLPVFDFKSRSRIYDEAEAYTMGKDDVLVVEGLHALSDEVCNSFNPDEVLKLFIMPNGRMYSDGRMLNRTDMRKIRRISRDVCHRNTSALATLDFWPIIKRTEDRIIMKYLDKADFYINSALDYEYCILPPLAGRQLNLSIEKHAKGDLPPSPNVKPGLFYADLNAAIKDAKRLAHNCELLPSVSYSVVPDDSILKEFI